MISDHESKEPYLCLDHLIQWTDWLTQNHLQETCI
jgi:hypothetical protein